MKVNFGAGIETLDGEAMLMAPDRPWTIGRMAADCLLARDPRDASTAMSVAQVSERYALALRLVKGQVEEITVAEADLIQRAVALHSAPIAAAQIIALTNA